MINNFLPRLIAFEITRTCTLNCLHCRAGSKNEDYPNELTFDEIKNILDNVASFSKPIIILTGGEPLTRTDVFDIASLCTKLSLTPVLATCGLNINVETISKIKKSGIKRLSFSIDGSIADSHDAFRGTNGIFDNVIQACQLARDNNVDFQINTTVTNKNKNELADILNLAEKLGAKAFHPFFLVPTGRAKTLKKLEMNPLEYEETLNKLFELEKQSSIEVKPTCAPHYHRIAGKKSRGCLAGHGFAFISSTGKIQTCGFLDLECGDLRKEKYNFEKIWTESEIFNRLREQSNYTGKCAKCNFYNVCGGCRARAYESTGDYLAEEPNCLYYAN